MTEIPLRDISNELLAEMRERVWLYTASVFAIEGTAPVYAGTASLVAAGGNEYLLTAAHVWHELRGDRFALSLEADRLLVPLQKDLLEPMVMGGADFGEWGPDHECPIERLDSLGKPLRNRALRAI